MSIYSSPKKNLRKQIFAIYQGAYFAILGDLPIAVTNVCFAA
jgi:hypothetical protein